MLTELLSSELVVAAKTRGASSKIGGAGRELAVLRLAVPPFGVGRSRVLLPPSPTVPRDRVSAALPGPQVRRAATSADLNIPVAPVAALTA